jgi:predicted nucleic acid-binding protein
VLLSFMSRMEILYRVTADEDEESARSTLRLLESTGIGWVSCEEAILEVAARIKARGGLSVADAWIASTALRHDAVLVHKDPEFERVEGLRQERLPR